MSCRPYFLHFLGENLEGILIAKEPADFPGRYLETTPVKQMVRSKRQYPGSLDRDREASSSSSSPSTSVSPSPAKKQRTSTPVHKSGDVSLIR